MSRCSYRIEENVEGQPLVIKDMDVGPSVTNDVWNVVEELFNMGLLDAGRRLFYYDTMGRLDEICHEGRTFTGFAPGSEVRVRGWEKLK